LITEPYEPEEFIAHKHARCKVDPTDGEKYIDKTIDWKIQKVRVTGNFVVLRTFDYG
jgi:hypothetical protein